MELIQLKVEVLNILKDVEQSKVDAVISAIDKYYYGEILNEPQGIIPAKAERLSKGVRSRKGRNS